MVDTNQDEFVELARVGYRVEADLLAAFLEDDGIRFKLIKNAQTMASLMPQSEVPVVFHVLKEDYPRAKSLLEVFKENQINDVDEDEPADGGR